jgi:hypothetical protein
MLDRCLRNHIFIIEFNFGEKQLISNTGKSTSKMISSNS